MSPRHRALFRAVVAPATAAHEAWAQWCALVPIAQADQQESQVLPLLAQRVTEGGFDAAHARRLRGLRRHASIRHFLVLEELAVAADAWRAVGIVPVALKGVALAEVYGTTNVRTVGDADVLVPAHQRRAAVDAMLAAGFRLGLGLQPEHLDVWAQRFHALPLSRPGLPEVDLHWRLSHQPVECDATTAAVFRRAALATAGSWRVPHPSHQLAITVAHGWAATSQASLRMMVDVAFLLTDATVTAEMVEEVAGPHRLRAAVRAVVAELAAEQTPGAAELLERLPATRWGDRLVARTLLADNESLATRASFAMAHRRPGMLRPPPMLTLPVGAPAAARSGAVVSLCGSGWWLGDHYATWSRNRVARLQVQLPESSATVRLTLALPAVGSGRSARSRRVLLTVGGKLRVVRCHGTEPVVVDLAARPGAVTNVLVVAPRMVVPHLAVGNGDRRRLGVGLLAVGAP